MTSLAASERAVWAAEAEHGRLTVEEAQRVLPSLKWHGHRCAHNIMGARAVHGGAYVEVSYRCGGWEVAVVVAPHHLSMSTHARFSAAGSTLPRACSSLVPAWSHSRERPEHDEVRSTMGEAIRSLRWLRSEPKQ